MLFVCCAYFVSSSSVCHKKPVLCLRGKMGSFEVDIVETTFVVDECSELRIVLCNICGLKSVLLGT